MHIYLSLCVCMCVCMFVCVYVCVCMNVFIYVYLYVSAAYPELCLSLLFLQSKIRKAGLGGKFAGKDFHTHIQRVFQTHLIVPWIDSHVFLENINQI